METHLKKKIDLEINDPAFNIKKSSASTKVSNI